MNKEKEKNSVLKIERPHQDKPSTLKLAEESKNTKKAGRKPIPIEEKGTEQIAIKITKEQKQAIEKQAGLIPVATFLKAKLKECGVL
jgi:hypothetical protein